MTRDAGGCVLPILACPVGGRSRDVGVLHVTRGQRTGRLPLAGVAIQARVADRVATVLVRQTFHNPCPEPIEAVYVFPLAGAAAVSEFELKVGGRVVRGRVQERGAARQQYQQALQEGKRAAMLEQERDDLFTVQVGNLPPGECVEVSITYSERLPWFDDGTTELRLPLVVAPRYIPGQPLSRDAVGDGVVWDTDQVPDASRLTPPRLAPGFDPRVALSIVVDLRAGVAGLALSDLSCSQHAIRTGLAADGARIELALADEALDRDFVLRWRLAQGELRASLLAHTDGERGRFGMLTIVPPRREGFLGLARDVVFVLDRSGSMQGVKMASAARACSLLLQTLGPRDRFALQAFDDRVEWHLPGGMRVGSGPDFCAADETSVSRGDQWLRGVEARGGTELDGAIGAALKLIRERRDVAGRMPVVVVVTDGQIGNESQVLKRLQQEVGDARVFSVGIDTAVNGGFLRRLAALGGGTAAFVEPGVHLEQALRAIGREIGAPLITDLRVLEGGAGGEVGALAPNPVPDLFEGRAVTVFFPMPSSGTARVSGRWADGRPWEETVTCQDVVVPAIAHLWARARVTDLEDRFRIAPAEQQAIRTQIIDLAVRHTLLTRFTAFLAVDESEVVNPDGTVRKVVQPVADPAKWDLCRQTEAAEALRGGIQPGTMFYAGVVAPMPMSMAAPGAMPPPPPAPRPAPLKTRSAERRQGAPPEPSKAESEAEGFEETSATDTRRGRQAVPGAVQSDLDPVRTAFAELTRALDEVRAAVVAGRVPQTEALERARAALLVALSRVPLGTEVPLLQRFLRGAAVELVAALRAPGMTATAIATLLACRQTEWAGAEAELRHRLGSAGPAPAAGPAFWEGTV